MREPAWRLFAAEYNDSQRVIKGEGDKAPTYVVTPLGARVNRLFIVGVLTDIEEMGTEGIRRRARISDPTGIHVVYAESFNPDVANSLAELEIPSYVGVVGKVRVYEPEEGMVYLSLRAETVKSVSIETRNYWIIEAGKSILGRINAIRDALNMENPTPNKLLELGHPTFIAEGAIEALRSYKTIDPNYFETLLREALSFTTEGTTEVKTDHENEETLLLLVIEEHQREDGAPWEEVAEAAIKKGIERGLMEEVVITLMEKGMVYEPQLGKLKLV